MNEPDPERNAIPDLEKIEAERVRRAKKKKGRWLDFLNPFAGVDFKVYRSLLGFVRPYAWRIVVSIALAAVSAGFLAGQFWILDQGLLNILGTTQGEVHDCPICEGELVVVTKPEQSDLEKLPFIGGDGEEEGEDDSRTHQVRKHDPSDHANHQALTDDEKASKRRELFTIAILLILAVAAEGAIRYVQAVMMAVASRRVVQDLRMHVFGHLMNLSTRFHQKNHSAHLVSRITHDLQLFGRFLTNVTVQMMREGFSFLGMLMLIVYKQGAFIFVVAGIVVAGMAPIQMFARKLRKRNQATQAGMAEIYAFLTEALVGQRIVKAFGGEKRESDRFHDANENFLRHILKVRKLRSATEALVPTIASVGTGAVIVWGGMKVLNGDMNGAAFMLIILALARAMASLRIMSRQISDFHIGMAAAERVNTLLQVRPEVEEKVDAKELPPFEDAIRYENLRFAHENEATLQGIDLEIRRGETVALVGPSGAGKSTLTDLLPRFFDPDSGRITIDGLDLRDVTLASLRHQIGIVTQETILFRDSVAENIAYGRPEATREEIEEAARQANAHNFIVKMPQGYDTKVGEKGHRMSGGERQRVAIARALLKNPPILILDEATSALDSESEIAVQNALNRLMENRTVVVIAHRLSTVRDADRIVVLEKGRVVEIGHHKELMVKNGLYRKLYDMQLEGLEQGKVGVEAS